LDNLASLSVLRARFRAGVALFSCSVAFIAPGKGDEKRLLLSYDPDPCQVGARVHGHAVLHTGYRWSGLDFGQWEGTVFTYGPKGDVINVEHEPKILAPPGCPRVLFVALTSAPKWREGSRVGDCPLASRSGGGPALLASRNRGLTGEAVGPWGGGCWALGPGGWGPWLNSGGTDDPKGSQIGCRLMRCTNMQKLGQTGPPALGAASHERPAGRKTACINRQHPNVTNQTYRW